MESKTTAQALREAEDLVARLRAQRAREVAAEAHRRVRDVEAFRALSDAERLDMYNTDPEVWRQFMAEWRQAGEQRLLESSKGERGGVA